MESRSVGSIPSDRLRAEWAKWIRPYAWTHWVTLTTGARSTRVLKQLPSGRRVTVWKRSPAPTLSTERLVMAFGEEFIRYLEKVSQSRVYFAFTVEGGALGDRPHLHAVLLVGAAVAPARLARAWRNGRATVERYDPDRAAVWYMLKEMGGRVLDYGVRLPPIQDRARGGYTDELGGDEANPRRRDGYPAPASQRDSSLSPNLDGQP